MDKPILTIEALQLNDETAAKVQEFLYALLNAIDEHYYPKITRYYRSKARCEYCEDIVLF